MLIYAEGMQWVKKRQLSRSTSVRISRAWFTADYGNGLASPAGCVSVCDADVLWSDA